METVLEGRVSCQGVGADSGVGPWFPRLSGVCLAVEASPCYEVLVMKVTVLLGVGQQPSYEVGVSSEGVARVLRVVYVPGAVSVWVLP